MFKYLMLAFSVIMMLLKLVGIIDISWWLVLLPIWLSFTLIMVLSVIMAVLAIRSAKEDELITKLEYNITHSKENK